jgi:O-antigen ligase
MTRIGPIFGQILLLTVPFLAAWVCAPRMTMEQYEIPKGFALILAVSGLVAVVGFKRAVSTLRAQPALAILLTAITVASLLSVSPALSIRGEHENQEGLLTWLMYAALFTAGTRLAGRDRMVLRTALVLAAAGSAVFALVQFAGLNPLSGGYFRHVIALTGNPDFLAQHLAMALPLALHAAMVRGSVPGAMAAAVFLLVLGLTGSRAGMLAGIAGIALIAIDNRRHLGRRPGPAVAIAVLLVSSLAISETVSTPGLSLYTRLDSLLSGTGLARTRGLVWQGTLHAIRERPLTGYGPDTLKSVFMKHAPVGWASLTELGMSERRAHCEPLHLAVIAGIPALGIYLWLLAGVFRAGTGSSRPPEFYAVVACLIHNLFFFSSAATAPVFWLMLGMIGAVPRSASRVSRPKTINAGRWTLNFLPSATIACILVVFAAVRFTADAYAYRGNEAGRAENRQGEADYFGLALRLTPREPAFLVRRARALEVGNSLAEALVLYERASALDPADGLKAGHVGRVRFALAEAAESREGMESALADMVRAVDLAPSQPTLYGAALMAAQKLGRQPDMDALAARLRARDPDWAVKMLGPPR